MIREMKKDSGRVAGFQIEGVWIGEDYRACLI